MRSDSVKNMSAYADQNHAPSLAAARLEITFLCSIFYVVCSTIYILYISLLGTGSPFLKMLSDGMQPRTEERG